MNLTYTEMFALTSHNFEACEFLNMNEHQILLRNAHALKWPRPQDLEQAHG